MASSGLRRVVNTMFERVAPGAFLALSAGRARARTHRLFAEWGCLALNDALIQRFGRRVLSGPFAGMELTSLALRDHIGPYLLGTYEHELHATWRDLERARFSAIFDIGSRFGYYAVGLARRYPGVPVTAVDPDRWAREATREMATANATPGVRLVRRMTAEGLEAALPRGALVVSDCEGYERALFCERDIPALRTATMIIEIHEAASPGVGDAIVHRFEATHEVRRVDTDPALPEPPVDLSFLDPDRRQLAVNEIRAPQQWLVLRPRAS